MSRSAFDELVKLRGWPADCAEWFWNVNDSKNWLGKDGQPIRKIEPLMINAVNGWRQQKEITDSNGRTVKFTKPDGKSLIQKMVDALPQ